MKSPKWLGIVLIVLLGPALSGCAIPLVAHVVDNLPWPQPRPYDADLVQSFSHTILKQSSSAEVLSTIHRPKDEILSQGESVLASCGEKKSGRRKWLNAVAFDEDVLTARCKYLLIVTEAPPILFPQWHKCRIVCRTVWVAECRRGCRKCQWVAVAKCHRYPVARWVVLKNYHRDWGLEARPSIK